MTDTMHGASYFILPETDSSIFGSFFVLRWQQTFLSSFFVDSKRLSLRSSFSIDSKLNLTLDLVTYRSAIRRLTSAQQL